MKSVLFTKLLKGLSLDDVARIGQELGVDGIDLLVRSGHQVTPAEPEVLGAAVRRLEGHGLSVAAITTDITDPANGLAETLFAASADAGVRLIRLGYWNYGVGDRYQRVLDAARRHLDDLEQLARRYRVRPMIQLHGGTIHSSGVMTAALLDGHDPAFLGAYPDPGNQAVQDGREDWRLTFDVLEPWLCFVGVKNGGWSSAGYGATGQRQWHSDWLGIAEGMVPWDEILGWLAERHSEVPLSFHSHYEVPLEQALEQTRADIRYVRGLLASTGAEAPTNAMGAR
jgi:sugar phosphate isomerase/epimerase